MIEREREICILYILHGALRSFSQFAATALSPSWRHSESMRALLPTFNCAQGAPWRIVARNMQPNEHARSRTVILPVSWTMLRLIWQPIRVCVCVCAFGTKHKKTRSTVQLALWNNHTQLPLLWFHYPHGIVAGPHRHHNASPQQLGEQTTQELLNWLIV